MFKITERFLQCRTTILKLRVRVEGGKGFGSLYMHIIKHNNYYGAHWILLIPSLITTFSATLVGIMIEV